MRICSLLPGATEIGYLLGLGDQIVGVTHECNYPPDAQYKLVVVRSAIDAGRMSSAEIDRKVAELLQAGKGLYTIDERKFFESAPDVILTQGLCDVCALDYDEVVKAAQRLPTVPQIVSLNPHSLTDILDDIMRVGAATGREAAAASVIHDLR
jgi:iron complex transport system substrate-binding protein